MTVSTLALLVALGTGGAYAAQSAGHLAKNSVTSKQIKNGTITGVDIKVGAITGRQVADGSLTGADVDSATLGKVPSAVHAATVDTVVHVSKTLPATPAATPATTVLTRGPLNLDARCITSSPVAGQVDFFTTTDDAAYEAQGPSLNLSADDVDVTSGPDGVAFAQNIAGSTFRGFRLLARAADGTTLTVLGSVKTSAIQCSFDFVVVG